MKTQQIEIVGSWLKEFFTNVVYPFVIIVTCLLLFATVIFVTIRAKSPRAVVAALLPVAALPFLVVTQSYVADPVMQAIGQLYQTAKFAIGMAVAILLIELGRVLLRRESEIGPAIFIFFLGSTGSFIVYALMANVLATTPFLFFGFVFGGGFYMILRGVPVPRALLKGWPFGVPLGAQRTNQQSASPPPPSRRSVRTENSKPESTTAPGPTRQEPPTA